MKKLLALLIVLASPAAFAVNPAIGGHAISSYIGGTTCSGCVSATTSATGSSFVVYIQIGGNDVLTVSDTYNISSKWTLLTLGSGANPIDESNDGEWIDAFVCLNCAGGTADAVTVTGAGNNLRYVELIEVTNSMTADVSASAYNASTAQLSIAVTPTVANDAIVAAQINCAGSAYTLVHNGAGWTDLEHATTTCNQGSATLTGATTSAQNALMGRNDAGSTALAGITIAFKPAAGASCTHSGKTSAGAISIPTAGSTVVSLKAGTLGTVDCSTTQYLQPTVGNFGTS